uniref:Uncharacterized protein n=1 Tax=Megaselia scalaris TaxID=36166 RepID=T1GLQ3_MEGSC
MRQDYYLDCLAKNRLPLIECDKRIRAAFKKENDIISPKLKPFFEQFYEKSEKIGDMMTVLRMPKTLPTFQHLHFLDKSINHNERNILCCHLYIFWDDLKEAQKKCKLVGRNSVIFNERFKKDVAKISFHTIFFACDPCICTGKCERLHKFLDLIFIYYLLANSSVVKNFSSISGYLQNLKELIIPRNDIKAIEEGAFPESLEGLELARNKIENIDYFLGNLTNLKYLGLFGNQIKYISRYAFKDLIKLKMLDLDMNYIRTITVHHLVGLINLQSLFIMGNKNFTFDDEIKDWMVELEVS